VKWRTDNAAALDYGNSDMTIEVLNSALRVTTSIDTEAEGLSAQRNYAVELWVHDTVYGRHLLDSFTLRLTLPNKDTWGTP